MSIDWNTANEEADLTDLSECTNSEQVSMTVTYTKFNLDFQFSHWFEVASMSIESETGVGTFSIRDATLKVEFKPYLNAERLRLAIVHFDFEFDDHSLVLYRAQDSSLNEGVFEQFAGIYLEHMRKQMEVDLPAKLAVKL